MIIISKYNPKWTEEFESIKSSLHEILGDLALRIDHIGSTSVPGLGAKDVIDVQITVKELNNQIQQTLENAGYKYSGTIAHDHVPQGENDNPKLWEKFFFNEPEGSVEPIFIFGLMVTPTKYIHCCFGTTSVLILIRQRQSNL